MASSILLFDSYPNGFPAMYQFSFGFSSYVIIMCSGLLFSICTAASVTARANASF